MVNIIQKLINKRKKEANVVTTRQLAKHMQKTRTMLVLDYNEKNWNQNKKNTITL